jgi:hypothetical protein
MPTLPEESMRRASMPFVEKPKILLSLAGVNIPVLASLVNL